MANGARSRPSVSKERRGRGGDYHPAKRDSTWGTRVSRLPADTHRKGEELTTSNRGFAWHEE